MEGKKRRVWEKDSIFNENMVTPRSVYKKKADLSQLKEPESYRTAQTIIQPHEVQREAQQIEGTDNQSQWPAVEPELRARKPLQILSKDVDLNMEAIVKVDAAVQCGQNIPTVEEIFEPAVRRMSEPSQRRNEQLQFSFAQQMIVYEDEGTKLTRFLHLLREHLMRDMLRYLDFHRDQVEKMIQRWRSKPQKLRPTLLYEDIQLIYMTKQALTNDILHIPRIRNFRLAGVIEKQQEKFNRKNYGQRIRKRLPDLTQQQIRKHMEVNANFSFHYKTKKLKEFVIM